MKENKKEEDKEKENPFNVILLGNVESEKEALMHKLIKKKFAINQLKELNKSADNANSNPNITDMMNSVEIHGETVKMKIYDNTSANKIFSYSNKSLSSVQGIILFYSVCDRNSFNILKSNLYKIMSMNKYDFPMVMVGYDSESSKRQVNYEEAKSLADSYGLNFYEVSFDSGIGLEPIFEDIGEQVAYKEYGLNDSSIKNNSVIFSNNSNNNKDWNGNLLNIKGRNKNISIYSNNELYENEFNKSIKSKMLKKNSYIFNTNSLSNRKNKLKTYYRTINDESKSSKELNDSNNTFSNNKKNKTIKTILIKSPDLIYPSEMHSYRGTTETQKKREEEIKIRRLIREKEMKSWWKKREKENLESKKIKREKEKNDLKEKIKMDKIIQKEKEKKLFEENLMKIKLNYEQKKSGNKKIEQEIIKKKENLIKEKLQEKKINKEKLNKLKEDKEIEEKEREKKLLNLKIKSFNINKKKDKACKNVFANSANKNSKKEKTKLKLENNKNKIYNLSQNNSFMLKDEQNNTSSFTHYTENKNDLIENYKNNSNIFRCLKCKLIPDILINELNQEIEIICDRSYQNNLHHNISTYSNFIEQSLNHPIDSNNIFCSFCEKYANEFSDENVIYFCHKCDTYFCSEDEEKHKSLMHKKEENIKGEYLNIFKNKKKEKSLNRNNSKLMINTPMKNKNNKKLSRQNTTPHLSRKQTNNKIIPKKLNYNDNNNKNSENSNLNSNINKKNYSLPFYLIDSFCGNHYEVFKFYCLNCHNNFCEQCLKDHINHPFIKFDDILLSDDELNSKKNELNKAKEDLIKLNQYFTALIEAIKCKFERLLNIKKKELEIKEKIILDYETVKYNYHSINNIRNIKFENNDKFFDLSPNTDWLTQFNLIFKYLNTNLFNKNNDVFDLLKSDSINEKNNIKISTKEVAINQINKLILLNNEDIAVLSENKNIYIFDKDNLEEKLSIKISEKNNFHINDIIERKKGGLICCGFEYIKFINLGLNNQYYNLENEIKDNRTNIYSFIEFNNNIIITLNNLSNLKLMKQNEKYKYEIIDCYNYKNLDNYTEKNINQLIKLNSNSFILSSNKENCLYKFMINNNEKIKLDRKLENIGFNNENIYNNIIILHNENYLFVLYNECILLIDANKFNIIQRFFHNYQLINLFNYSENYIIALDSKNKLYKIEFDKNQQKLFFEDNVNINNNYSDFANDINNIIIYRNRDKIIFQKKNKFVKIDNF